MISALVLAALFHPRQADDTRSDTRSGIATTAIGIDARTSTPISPYIYGLNDTGSIFPGWAAEWAADSIGTTLSRQGGNRMTAYNWETNASNAGNDYFNENDDYMGGGETPGLTVSRFMSRVQSTGAAVLLTVPTQGYVSADKIAEMNGSKDVGNTPDYLNVRFHKSYANKPGGQYAYPPDLTDRAVYQDEFVKWAESAKSPASPVWYALDNEPDLWHSTHSRIETSPTTYARIFANNIEFATMIKRVAPSALVLGPGNYGWAGYRTFQGAPDANGRDFVDTYLDSMRAASAQAGKRLLDAYDFHWYPEAQGDGKRIVTEDPDTPGLAKARIQAPRSLWDPTYVETSWITGSNGGKAIRLIPDMAGRVAGHYPGTKLAITEYDFGGRKQVSGMIAQADVLGIFGRYGLFAATHWGLNHKDPAAFAGFQAFTNFDRSGAKFGDQGLAVTGEIPAENSVYAALDSKVPGRLTVVAINKTSVAKVFRLRFTGFNAKSAQSYVITDGVYATPGRVSVRLVAGVLDVRAPALSVSSVDVRQ